MKHEIFENLLSFRNGSNASGVQRDLSDTGIPEEIKALMQIKKAKKSK